MSRAVLRADGGARGNPGPAGAGIVLEVDGAPLIEAGRFLGIATNNVAEYEALIWGLENARALGVRELTVYVDSELVVRQLRGEYRVKSGHLRELYDQVRRLMEAFDRVELVHVARAGNRAADLMANAAMDARATVGNPAVMPEPDAPEQGSLF